MALKVVYIYWHQMQVVVDSSKWTTPLGSESASIAHKEHLLQDTQHTEYYLDDDSRVSSRSQLCIILCEKLRPCLRNLQVQAICEPGIFQFSSWVVIADRPWVCVVFASKNGVIC